MVFSSVGRHILLASFLLAHASPLIMAPCAATGKGKAPMEDESSALPPHLPKDQKPLKINTHLLNGIDHFEAGNIDDAVKVFTKLAKRGALIASYYLHRMTTPEAPFTLPELGCQLGEEFYNASVAYKAKDIEMLGEILLKGNSYALSRVKKLLKSDESNALLVRLQQNTAFKKIKPNKLDKLDTLCKLDDARLLNHLNPIETNLKLKGLKDFNAQDSSKHIGQKALTVSKLHPEEMFWHHLAFENGEAGGCYELADFCGPRENKMIRANESFIKLSRYYYKIAADRKHIEAQRAYALMCLSGQGGEKDPVTAREYLKRSADQGQLDSQHDYALMCVKGEGGEKDPVTAREYFKRSADQERSAEKKPSADEELLVAQRQRNSQHSYALMCVEGEGGEKDPVTAREYFKRSADQRHPEAQRIYAIMCQKGEGGKKNLREAREYFKRSANQEHAMSQNNYAVMCYNGEGGEQDLDEAYKYFKRSAGHRNAEAQHNYAIMRYKGYGCKADLDEALKYFKHAADQGHSDAIIFLDYLKEEGLARTRPHPEFLGEQGVSTPESSEFYEIQLFFPEEEDRSSDEEDSSAAAAPPLSSEVGAPALEEKSPVAASPSPTTEAAGFAAAELAQELEGYKTALDEQIKIKKMNLQLIVQRDDYKRTSTNPQIKEVRSEEMKFSVPQDTLDLVKTIFGQGDRGIHTFRDRDLETALKTLGCEVEANRQGADTTIVLFPLEERKVRMTYHNPKSAGKYALHDGLKSRLQRFLTVIGRTPKDLAMK